MLPPILPLTFKGYIAMKHMITLMLMTLLLTFNSQAAPLNAHTTANPNDYALVFFFRSDCPFCHKFAPKLKQFSAQTGTYTYAFSLDNQGISGFEVPIPSTPDIATTFFENPRSVTVPATFLINVNTRKFVRLTVGDVTSAQLQQSYIQSLNDPLVIESMR
jgi:type-F conjugative transfer system pilin assembly thiol-disulfide isomerase TrbB